MLTLNRKKSPIFVPKSQDNLGLIGLVDLILI